LVRDMLFFAKPMNLSPEPNDIDNLLADATAAVSEIAQGNGITIDVHGERSCTCSLDNEKMLLVFINLFANAIEASPQGETVSVSVRQHANELSVDVSDKGTGIPIDIAGKIFEPFVSGKKKGTGLGLPICRKIVEAHSGKLEYRNNQDGGATFRIILPQGH